MPILQILKIKWKKTYKYEEYNRFSKISFYLDIYDLFLTI